MNKKILFVLILIIVGSLLSAVKKKNPTRAALYSFICPGAGEIYNEKYLKAGIFFSAELYFVGSAIYNHNEMKYYEDKLELYPSSLKYKEKYNDYFDKRNSDLWWIGITTFLSALDSFVDANLYNFEEKKKNIELKFENKMISLNYNF